MGEARREMDEKEGGKWGPKGFVSHPPTRQTGTECSLSSIGAKKIYSCSFPSADIAARPSEKVPIKSFQFIYVPCCKLSLKWCPSGELATHTSYLWTGEAGNMQLKQISTITHEEHALHLESPFQAYMQLDVPTWNRTKG